MQMELSSSISPVLMHAALSESDTARQKALLGKNTVLLVEDNDDLRHVMELTLRAMGYLVLSCADAQLASTAFRLHAAVDVLLTDFEMPGRTGLELARELTSLCPTLPVMIVTGTILTTTAMQEIHAREWTYVSKPCHLPSLETSLKAMLIPRSSAS